MNDVIFDLKEEWTQRLALLLLLLLALLGRGAEHGGGGSVLVTCRLACHAGLNGRRGVDADLFVLARDEKVPRERSQNGAANDDGCQSRLRGATAFGVGT